MTNFAAGVLAFLAVMALALAWSALVAAVAMWAWNMVMPSLFGVGELTYWQAVAIIVILSVIGWFIRGGKSE